jgi:glucans biosynthesis protein
MRVGAPDRATTGVCPGTSEVEPHARVYTAREVLSVRVWGLCTVVATLALTLPAVPAGAAQDTADGGRDSAKEASAASLFDRVTRKARQLAGSAYQPQPKGGVPEALAELDYDQYRRIRYRGDAAVWREQSPFKMELFHPGFLYTTPVTINTVVDGQVREIQFDRDLFRYEGFNLKADTELGEDLGFAGFRLHYPLNRPDYADEVISLLGASYFRMLGRGQVYGASARGLAIDTALPSGEEFPRFREFWLVRPEGDASTVTFYALLDSQSVTGAYRFVLEPGEQTVLDVRTRLFARNDVQRLGLAPLTSMFYFGENSMAPVDDFRPEVHDSDGLLIHGGNGDWIWRPLINAEELRVNALQETDLQGFGLKQRDRAFEHYLSLQAHYQQRPGLWVEPRGDGWGKGAVMLVQIPTDKETNDNIVAFWEPAEPLKAGESIEVAYKLRTASGAPEAHDLARAQRTRVGRGGVPGADRPPANRQRRFVIDFAEGELPGLADSQPVQGEVTAANGEVTDVVVEPLPGDRGWRLSFQARVKNGRAVDMQAFLQLRGQRLSERWSYVWYPDDSE